MIWVQESLIIRPLKLKWIFKIGKNWKLKPVLPNDEQMKELQQSGEEINAANIPKNLAFVFRPKDGGEWKDVAILYPSGIMEGDKFQKMSKKTGGK